MRFATLLLLAALFAPLASAQANLSGVVINEILADPDGGDGPNVDTDGDGASEIDDEFIEFYNTTDAAVDISGWEVYQVSGGNAVLAHTFASGTSIAAKGYTAVVGAWDPGTPPAGIVAATEGSLGLTNGGDEVFLLDPTADRYIGAYYNGAQTSVTIGTATLAGEDDFGDDADSKSIQRSPDGSTSFSVGNPTISAANASVAPETFMTILLGANEVEPVETDAAGSAMAVLTGTELVVTGRFDDLESDYAANIGSHLHRGAATENGPVEYALSPTLDDDNRGGTFEADNNTFTVRSTFADSLRNGLVYVNVHTADNNGGEVRGQLVEEVPATALTLRQVRIVGPGYTVTTSGTVSRAAGNLTYIQAEDGGITTFNRAGDFFDGVGDGTIKAGTQLDLEGETTEFSGVLQINLADYTVTGQGDAPDATVVTLAELAADGESFEGRLVTIEDARFTATGTFEAGTNYDISDASDATNTVDLRVPNEDDTDADGTAIPTGPTNITGIASEFRGSLQILLLEASDLSMGTDGENGPVEQGYTLRVANPAPAGAAVTLTATVAGDVTLELFDTLGRRVATLVDGPVSGVQTARLGDTLASGTYVLRLTTDAGTSARTITVVR